MKSTYGKSKQLEENVKKILEARKVQKDRIENARNDDIVQTEKIERKSKTVVDTLKSMSKTQKDDSIQLKNQQALETDRIIEQLKESSLDNNKMLNYLISQQAALQGPGGEQDDDEEEREEGEEESGHARASNLWIRDLYQTHRNTSKNRSTHYEIELNEGRIGLKGKIDLSMLFNYNIVKLSIDGKTAYMISSDKVTKGLAALLLLPYNDITESKIDYTPTDIRIYKTIMEKSGYKPGASKKYGEIWKNVKTTSGERSKPEVHGTGVFAYSNPKMLEERLELLAGSVKAGNTSMEIKNEIRSIVDEMLRIQVTTPRIHKLLYNKFGFLH